MDAGNGGKLPVRFIRSPATAAPDPCRSVKRAPPSCRGLAGQRHPTRGARRRDARAGTTGRVPTPYSRLPGRAHPAHSAMPSAFVIHQRRRSSSVVVHEPHDFRQLAFEQRQSVLVGHVLEERISHRTRRYSATRGAVRSGVRDGFVFDFRAHRVSPFSSPRC